MIKTITRFPKFLKEVKAELKKVNWSTRQELIGATLLVLISTGLMLLYIWGVDSGFSNFLKLLLK